MTKTKERAKIKKSTKLSAGSRRPRKKKVNRRVKVNPEIKVYCLIALVSVIFIELSFTVFFKIENVKVNKCDMYTQQEIIDGSGIKRGSNLLLLSKNDAAENILNNFAYIEDVKITKKLPSSIEINVKPGAAVFAVEKSGEYFYISEKGRVLEKSYETPENLLVIRGVNIGNCNECSQIQYLNPEQEKAIKEIRENIKKHNLDKVDSIDLSDLSEITLNYDKRIDILIGKIDKCDYKIITAREILGNKLSENEEGKLNVTELDKDNRSYFTPKIRE